MKSHLSIRRMIIFAMLGAMMFVAKIAFEALPNIHPLGMIIMVMTVVYRAQALIPIYLFVFISGLYYGFQLWWIPYLYIWAILWAATMLIPRDIPRKAALIVYPVVCGMFGLLYGTLYAPAQALLFHYDFATTLKWIGTGLPFDAAHGLGNLGMGLLVYPVSQVLLKLEKNAKA